MYAYIQAQYYYSRVIMRQEQLEKLIKWSIFATCFIGLTIEAFRCIEKWWSNPQGFQISTQHQTKVDFPAITFCPFHYNDEYGNPLAYEPYFLENCGLDLKGNFTFDSECEEYQVSWKDLTPKLENFGISEAKVGFLADDKIQFLSLNESDSIWRQTISLGSGACYSLILPENITRKGVHFVKFLIDESNSFEIVFHPKGLFNIMDPWRSLAYASVVFDEYRGADIYLDYEHTISLDIDGKACEKNLTYDFMNCINEEILRVS